MVLMTQMFTFFFIIVPLCSFYEEFFFPFGTLVAASFFIVSGGYIINDLYDVEIDKQNKPDKMVVGKSISGKLTQKIYFIHLLWGAAFSVLTAYLTKSFAFGLFLLLTIAILWFYSYRLKKEPFLGNMVVAIMAAAPVYTVLMVMFFSDWNMGDNLLTWIVDNQQIVGFIFGYSFFAVTTHFLREIVKDIQDMAGDKAFRCLTVPIKYGKKRAAIISQWITAVVIAFLVIAQLIFFVNDYLLMGFYSFLVIVFLIMIFIRIRKAEIAEDFGKASSLIKWMMLVGILSMILIPFS